MKQSEFLFGNTSESYDSARIVVDVVFDFFKNRKSFMDVGCGLGGWSRAFEDFGIQDYRLFDHPAINREDLLITKKEKFLGIDLDKHLPDVDQVDFAICIEVLEHFEKERALQILDFITKTTNLVLFSAAIPNQKGVGHVNEQRHSFWHKEFADRGFDFYDGFKPKLFDKPIKFFYVQNLFLYYKTGHENQFKNLDNISSTEFELVSSYILNKEPTLSDLLKKFPEVLMRSLNNRLKS